MDLRQLLTLQGTWKILAFFWLQLWKVFHVICGAKVNKFSKKSCWHMLTMKSQGKIWPKSMRAQRFTELCKTASRTRTSSRIRNKLTEVCSWPKIPIHFIFSMLNIINTCTLMPMSQQASARQLVIVNTLMICSRIYLRNLFSFVSICTRKVTTASTSPAGSLVITALRASRRIPCVACYCISQSTLSSSSCSTSASPSTTQPPN